MQSPSPSHATHSRLLFPRLLSVAIAFLAVLSAQSVRAQNDTGTIYLNAYLNYEDGEKLEAAGNLAGALSKYLEAKNVFDTIARTDPDWREEVLTYRRRKTNEAIGHCRARLPQEIRPPNTGARVKGYPPPAERAPYIPPRGADASTSLIGEKDAKIEQLRGEKDNLLDRLHRTQGDLERTLQDLRTSEIAKATLRKSLQQTQERLMATDLDPAAMKRLESEVKRLTNELAIANEAREAADKRNEKLTTQLQGAKDIIASLQTEREELMRERDQMEDLLKGGNDDDIKRLLGENVSLKKELASAQAEAKKLSSEKKRDTAQIAALRERLTSVESRLAELQKENSAYQDRIASLSAKLRSTEAKLKENPSGDPAATGASAAASEENKALLAIVKRQIMQQAWRKQAKELVMAELMRSGNTSRALFEQIERLSGEGTVLTPAEQQLLHQSLFPDGAIIHDGGGDAKYPNLAEANDGPLNDLGLNDNLTAYARAVAIDSRRGDFADCEGHYDALLQRAPDNVYLLRNQGIVKMRLGKGEEAEELFKQALAIDGSDGYSHFILGVNYYRGGRDDLAMSSVEQGLQITPDNARAHFYLGAICIKKQMRERARQAFQDVVAIKPGFGDAYYNLAYLYATDTPPRLDLARDFYLRAQRNGTSPDIAMDRALGT